MTGLGAGADDLATAFDAFVLRRHTDLVRFGYVLTGNRAGAEDLVQTALCRTYVRWDRLDDRGDPTAYVRRVMVNAHISWTRRLSSKELLFAEPPEGTGDEDGHDLERVQMWRQLAALPARMRAVLVLRFYEDLSEAETARVLGCAVGTVKSQTSRGLARLRRELAEASPLLTEAVPARPRARTEKSWSTDHASFPAEGS